MSGLCDLAATNPVKKASPYCLHPDVEVLRGGPEAFVMLNRATGDHRLLNTRERYLVELLQRSASLEDVLAGFRERFGLRIESAEVRSFLESLLRLRLLVERRRFADSVATASAIPQKTRQAAAGPPRGTRLNLAFDLATLLFGWLLHPFMLVPLGVLTAVAAKAAYERWDLLVADFGRFFAAFPLPLYVLAIILPKLLLLNLLHTGLCGIVCRKHGGWISRYALVLWKSVLPVFRIEIGDSMILIGRRGRRTMVLVGLCLPLAVGSAAVLLWAMTLRSSSAADFLLSLLPPVAFRMLLQCNPFYTSGSLYLAVSEMMHTPRLLSAARTELREWLWRRASIHYRPHPHHWPLRMYGLAWCAYRLLLDAVLVICGWISLKAAEPVGVVLVLAAAWLLHHGLLRRDADE